jgi:manganese transport protein
MDDISTETTLREEPRIDGPPTSLREFLDYMGPAWVFTASQIGGGEVLSVPIIAAYLGMDAIWLIPVVGLSKIFGQFFLVSQAVMTGNSFIDRLARKPWWLRWIFYYAILGGMFYAMGISGHLATTAGAFQSILPLSNEIWMGILVVLAFGLVSTRTYDKIEKISLVSLWLFLGMVLIIGVMLFPSISAWIDGLTAFPGHVGALGGSGWYIIALSFGWTGAGFASTIAYVWFAKDKGMGMLKPYSDGLDLNREDLTNQERENLSGWYRIVFYQNAIASVLLVTFSMALWVAAARTLHPQGIRPSGFGAVSEMANIFTQFYGGWAGVIFLVAVSLALFSSIYAPAYGISRMWEDAFGSLGGFERFDISRKRLYQVFVAIFLATPLLFNLVIGNPLILFSIGGILFAPIVGLLYLAGIYLLYDDISDSRLLPQNKALLLLALFAAATTIISSALAAISSV